MMRLLVVCLAALAASPALCAPTKPNLVFVLADDLDLLLGGTAALNRTKALLGDKGATLDNHFTNTPVCCPSRIETLTGRYGHNQVVAEAGCMHLSDTSEQFLTNNIGSILQKLGYSTGMFGKYLNAPCFCDEAVCKRHGGPLGVYPGWDEFYAVCNQGQYFDNVWNHNSFETKTGTDPASYMTSVIGNSSLSWIKGQIATDPDKPFFAYIAPHGPHISDDVYPYWTTPAPWYNHTIPDTQTAPRTVSWNKQNKGAHPLVANQPLMNEQNIAFSDGSYRRRLEATMSVDDIVGDLVQLLEATNQINNTYIFFTSDHGFSLGQLCQPTGKWNVYEHHIRVPGMIRGPGIVPGRVLKVPTGNVDYAPTFVQLAGGSPTQPALNFDGRSMAPLLVSPPGQALVPWRDTWLVEYWSLGDVLRGAPASRQCNPRDGVTDPGCPDYFHLDDGPDNTYAALRVINETYDVMYAEFFPAGEGHPVVTDFTAVAPVFYELYNMTADPGQLNNLYSTFKTEPWVVALHDELMKQVKCRGPTCV